MIKSVIKNERHFSVVCPKCKQTVNALFFESGTGLYINIIRLKKFHSHKFMICPNCKTVFEEKHKNESR